MSYHSFKEQWLMLDDAELRLGLLADLADSYDFKKEDLEQDRYRIKGCASKVWLQFTLESGCLKLYGNSDALMTKALVHLLIIRVQGKTVSEVKAMGRGWFDDLGLKDYLSFQRWSGFNAMIEELLQWIQQQ